VRRVPPPGRLPSRGRSPPRPRRRARSRADTHHANGAGLDDSTVAENTRSTWSFLSTVLPNSLTPKYITSQWSVAQFHTPGHPAVPTATRTICAFGSERNTIIVISNDGSFYKCSFDPVKGGECRRECYARFLQVDDDEFRAAD